MGPENDFRDLAVPGQQLKVRAKQMRRSAKRQRWTLLGCGAASFVACVATVVSLSGIQGMLAALTSLAGGAFGGILVLLIRQLRCTNFRPA